MVPQDIKASFTDFEENTIHIALTCAQCQLDRAIIFKIINKSNQNSTAGKFTPSQVRYAIDRYMANDLISNFAIDQESKYIERLIQGFNKLIRDSSNLRYCSAP